MGARSGGGGGARGGGAGSIANTPTGRAIAKSAKVIGKKQANRLGIPTGYSIFGGQKFGEFDVTLHGHTGARKTYTFKSQKTANNFISKIKKGGFTAQPDSRKTF